MSHSITFCLLTCGESKENQWYDVIKSMNGKAELLVIKNVSPQVKALNQMLEQTKTDYLIPADADAFLYNDAFHRIYTAIDKHYGSDDWHSILFPVWDRLTEQKILALKILRMSIVKHFSFEDTRIPDIAHYKALTDAGYRCIHEYLHLNPIAEHVVEGPKACYNRFKEIYMTYRIHNYEWDSGVFKGGTDLKSRARCHFDFFLEKYLQTDNDDYLYCIAGMMDGILCETTNKSKSFKDNSIRINKKLAIDTYVRWYNSDFTFSL